MLTEQTGNRPECTKSKNDLIINQDQMGFWPLLTLKTLGILSFTDKLNVIKFLPSSGPQSVLFIVYPQNDIDA